MLSMFLVWGDWRIDRNVWMVSLSGFLILSCFRLCLFLQMSIDSCGSKLKDGESCFNSVVHGLFGLASVCFFNLLVFFLGAWMASVSLEVHFIQCSLLYLFH